MANQPGEAVVPVSFLRFTVSGGITFSISTVFTGHVGLMVNSTQLGIYGNFAAGTNIVNGMRIVNSASEALGLGTPYSQANMDAMQEMARAGAGAFSSLSLLSRIPVPWIRNLIGNRIGGGLTIGLHLGSIEEQSSLRSGGEVEPSIGVSVGAPVGGLELNLQPSTETGVALNGSGVTILLGPHLGVTAGPNVTFAVPLFGENGTLINTRISGRVQTTQSEGNPAEDFISDPYTGFTVPRHCFLPGTPITMAIGSTLPIEAIRPGDLVLAFDPARDQGRGALVPARVTRTFRNRARAIIDLRGLKMTPGHVCLTDHGNFQTIAAILRRDGALVDAAGTRLRARTGAVIGSEEDLPVTVLYHPPGEAAPRTALVRAGITVRIETAPDGTRRALSLAAVIARHGARLLPDGSLRGPDGSTAAMTDWPPGATPFDTHEQRNWILRTEDGTPYTPDWILEAEQEAALEHPAEPAPGTLPGFPVIGSTMAHFAPMVH